MGTSNEPPTAATSPPPRAHETLEDFTRRERLQRVLARLNRLHEPVNNGAAPSTQRTSAAYGEQPPALGRQSLYNWVPAFAEFAQDEAELESILSEMRQHSNVATDPAVLRVMARAEMICQRGETRQDQNQTENVAARFTLQTIDPEAMTPQGTMETYDVPQHTGPVTDGSEVLPRAGRKAAPITTYVEGQVIDLRTHSFLTPSSHSASISPLERNEEAIRGERRTTSAGLYETAPQNATP